MGIAGARQRGRGDTPECRPSRKTLSIELKDLPRATNDVIQTTGDVETVLKTVGVPSMAARELAGVQEAMTRMRDELANNLAKLSATNDRKSKVEKHLAKERRKLTETDDAEVQQEIRDRNERLEGELSDIELERQKRLEALSTNRAALRSQTNKIRENVRWILREDTTLAERIRTLFREQGITIASILTAIGMAISTLVLAITGGGAAGTPSPAPTPSDKGGVKEWIKSTYRPLDAPWPNLPARPLRSCPAS